MKETSAKGKTSGKTMGTYDPELDKFESIDLFPEKTAEARAILKKYPVPEQLLRRSK